MIKTKKNSIGVYVCTHKEFNYNLPEDYIILHVGAENKSDLGYIKDSTGKNISIRNNNFCELTGLYWMWKNTNHSIIGLVHYRRYFFDSSLSAVRKKVITTRKVSNILKKYDIILPKKRYYKETVQEIYSRDHFSKDYQNIRKIIDKYYNEYLDAFDIISKCHGVYLFNMFICKKEVIDEYCKWLFDILFKLEKITDISAYDDYNKRIYGFLSERLFNVWIYQKKLKIKEVPVFNVENFSFISSCIKDNFSQLLKKLIYRK